jgi:hypothetical protein
MKAHRLKSAMISMAAALSMSACGDAEVEAPVEEPTAPQVESVSVVPTFTLSGIEELPGELYLADLGFIVSEIRMEPVLEQSSSVAYSAVSPQAYSFDVAAGERVQFGEAIELPRAGRYLVSVRFEPMVTPQDELISSFAISGFVAEGTASEVLADDDESRPNPYPFAGGSDDEGANGEPPDEGEKFVESESEAPEAWTPFFYHSERAVFFPLNDVEIQNGQQALEINFDVQRWAVEIVDPISNAVKSKYHSTGAESVDISSHLDSSGQGTEAFVERGSAQTNRRGGGAGAGFGM